MNRHAPQAPQTIGWILIAGGWSCFLFALCCPAVGVGIHGLDMYGWHEKLGAQCLLDSFNPINYFECPLLILYAPANVMMLFSGILVGVARCARPVWGWLFLACFCLTLSVPWCAADLKIRFGCVLWSVSFLQPGIGCLLLPTKAVSEKRFPDVARYTWVNPRRRDRPTA